MNNTDKIVERIKDFGNSLVDNENDGWVAFYKLTDYIDKNLIAQEINALSECECYKISAGQLEPEMCQYCKEALKKNLKADEVIAMVEDRANRYEYPHSLAQEIIRSINALSEGEAKDIDFLSNKEGFDSIHFSCPGCDKKLIVPSGLIRTEIAKRMWGEYEIDRLEWIEKYVEYVRKYPKRATVTSYIKFPEWLDQRE